ncbi:hypothetical protein FBU30_011091, partial [Linnemannia zychae]
MMEHLSSSTSRYSPYSSSLSLQSPASTGDHYLGFSTSTLRDRSQHYFSANRGLDDIPSSSQENPQGITSTINNAQQLRGCPAPEREQYRYDSNGRLSEQKSSPTVFPSSSPTEQQPNPQPQIQNQQQQPQVHPFNHPEHQSFYTIHHYPQHSQPSLLQLRQSDHYPAGSHLAPAVDTGIDSSLKKDLQRSPVAQSANGNNGHQQEHQEEMPEQPLPQQGQPPLQEQAWGPRVNKAIASNNDNHNNDPRSYFPIHAFTYPPATFSRNTNSSQSSMTQPPSFSLPPSSSPLFSSSVTSPCPSPASPSSSPITSTTRLPSTHPVPDTASAPLTPTSTAGALPLSTAAVPWNRSSLRHEITSMESPPTPVSSATFSPPLPRHSNSSHRHSHSCSTSSPPRSAQPAPLSLNILSVEPWQRTSNPIPTMKSDTVKTLSPSPSSSSGVGRQAMEIDDDQEGADTGSTFSESDASGQQQIQKRRGSGLSTAMAEEEQEDQEVPRAAAAGATADRGEQNSIMRAEKAIHHASQATGGDDYD